MKLCLKRPEIFSWRYNFSLRVEYIFVLSFAAFLADSEVYAVPQPRINMFRWRRCRRRFRLAKFTTPSLLLSYKDSRIRNDAQLCILFSVVRFYCVGPVADSHGECSKDLQPYYATKLFGKLKVKALRNALNRARNKGQALDSRSLCSLMALLHRFYPLK